MALLLSPPQIRVASTNATTYVIASRKTLCEAAHHNSQLHNATLGRKCHSLGLSSIHWGSHL